jgi:hypothetical protein
MSRIHAMATGAIVAVCLVAAGQIGATAGEQVAEGTMARTTAQCADVSANLASFLASAQKAFVRHASF